MHCAIGVGGCQMPPLGGKRSTSRRPPTSVSRAAHRRLTVALSAESLSGRALEARAPLQSATFFASGALAPDWQIITDKQVVYIFSSKGATLPLAQGARHFPATDIAMGTS